MSSLLPQPYFNSIKVRLEHAYFNKVLSGDAFQFHKGTIRTACVRAYIAYFNSIKVRLEQLKEYKILDKAIIFQFHKGTIRTREGVKLKMFFVISIP